MERNQEIVARVLRGENCTAVAKEFGMRADRAQQIILRECKKVCPTAYRKAVKASRSSPGFSGHPHLAALRKQAEFFIARS
jgi:hypothetical protein